MNIKQKPKTQIEYAFEKLQYVFAHKTLRECFTYDETNAIKDAIMAIVSMYFDTFFKSMEKQNAAKEK